MFVKMSSYALYQYVTLLWCIHYHLINHFTKEKANNFIHAFEVLLISLTLATNEYVLNILWIIYGNYTSKKKEGNADDAI